MLIAMLVVWTTSGRPHYPSMDPHQKIAYISDVGAQGLKPGRWRIDMPSSPAASYVISIPKGSKSLLRVGDLKPQPAENK